MSNILIIGRGGREHALAWRLAQSGRVAKIYVAPGNPGMQDVAEPIDLSAFDLQGLLDFAEKKHIDLTVVGPEGPLVYGIVDLFEEKGHLIFGPRKQATQLESSKIFTKRLMIEHGIPTAKALFFQDADRALKYLDDAHFPLVVKANGLAEGKGAFVCHQKEQAKEAVHRCMVERIFHEAGDQILIEEYLSGPELSLIIWTDSRTVRILEPARDYKQLLDGARGPNTAGMGAFSSSDLLSAQQLHVIRDQILDPMLNALQQIGWEYVGALFAGLILTQAGPKVLEFNVRMGDPEAQPLMLRFQGDLAEGLIACADRRLSEVDMQWDPRPAVCVVIASEGYPGSVETGKPISGLAQLEGQTDLQVFHGRTGRLGDRWITTGGRILSVTAIGDSVYQARQRVYDAIREINIPGTHVRTDIASGSA